MCMGVLVIVLPILAVVLTVGLCIYKQWLLYKRALDALSLAVNMFLTGTMSSEEYKNYRTQIYDRFNWLQRYWLKRQKGGSIK